MLSPDHHLFTLLGRTFLLDVPSGALFELDEQARTALLAPEKASPEARAEIEDLRARGFLQPDPIRLDGKPLPKTPWLKALCLHPAHDCNLRCAYCFASTGAYGGGRTRMTPETGRAAIDFLLANSGQIDPLEVDFFGGEPLLGMETVRATVAHARKREAETGKRINFTLTTNAVLLGEEILGFLKSERISLVLSLDGRPDTHDRFRFRPDGRGSYEIVAPRIVAAVAAGASGSYYYVRGTFTRYNPDFTADVRHLLDLGLERLSLEPVIAGDEAEYAWGEDDLRAVEAEYERLAAFYLERARAGRPFVFFHFEVDLEHGPCLGKRLSGCGAGARYLAVTPAGELYPCHQFVGREQYRLGDLESGITRPDLVDHFAAADIFRKRDCLDCWARYFCGGGCHANADLFNGSILRPDGVGCRLLRKRLECALAVKAILGDPAAAG